MFLVYIIDKVRRVCLTASVQLLPLAGSGMEK